MGTAGTMAVLRTRAPTAQRKRRRGWRPRLLEMLRRGIAGSFIDHPKGSPRARHRTNSLRGRLSRSAIVSLFFRQATPVPTLGPGAVVMAIGLLSARSYSEFKCTGGTGGRSCGESASDGGARCTGCPLCGRLVICRPPRADNQAAAVGGSVRVYQHKGEGANACTCVPIPHPFFGAVRPRRLERGRRGGGV